ncbi:hypothetical protein [Sphaerisporangium corydalis]|uniref:Uncharacterized protein n=1 Tax=Sphaerisporangium corydalis TaxID=1441875 RepID=A0ABV9EBS2_9ACTN
MAEPQHEAADGGVGEVVAGEFVKAGGDGSPSLELAEATFDQVGVLGDVDVEGVGAASVAALAFAVGDLVLAFGDDRLDPTLAQVAAYVFGGVALVCDQAAGAGARPAVPSLRSGIWRLRPILFLVSSLRQGYAHRATTNLQSMSDK